MANEFVARRGFISQGSLTYPYTSVTTTYAVTANDYFVNCASGTFTVSLPTAVGITGKLYVIKNSGTGVITVDPNGSETIDGSTTKTLTQYNTLSIQSNGTNWVISSSGGDVVVNPAANRLLTASGTSTTNVLAQSGLTYDGNKLFVYGSQSSILQVSGSSGNLVEVINQTTGNLLEVGSVNDIPIFSVNTDGVKYINGGRITINGSSSGIAKQIDVNSGSSLFFNYSVYTGTKANMRSGTLYAVWNSSTVGSGQTTGATIGTTSNITFSIDKNANYVNINYNNTDATAYFLNFSCDVVV